MQVDTDVAEALLRAVAEDPTLEITVDVERRLVSAPAIGIEAPFELDDATRHRFLEGLDDIGITLQHEADITAFEATRPTWLPSTR